MAIDLKDLYPHINGATADYPYGSFQNDSTGNAGDGSPVDNQWGNDIFGFLQALLVTAGVVPNGAPDTARSSQYLQALKKIVGGYVPAGVSFFSFCAAAPAGFLELNGGTIGNAGSGASIRANADMIDLYTALWAHSSLKSYTNLGAEVARGANAAADFAAGKRLAIPDMRGRHPRGWDHGAGVDPGRLMASYQADAVGPHVHPNTTPAALADSQTGGDTHNYGVLGNSGQNTGSTETRVKTIAAMWIIKY